MLCVSSLFALTSSLSRWLLSRSSVAILLLPSCFFAPRFSVGKLDVSRTRFLFWDLGGAASLRVLWDKYYSESHAILYILDSSSDSLRIDEAVREVRKLARDKDLREAPIIVLANKMDRKDAQGTEGIVAALGLPPSASIVTAAETKGGLRPSTATAASNGNAAATAALSSSSSSSPSVSSPSLASPASASASSSAASAGDAFDGHLVKVLPVSALTGQGVAKVIEMLQQILPSCPRTQRMAAEKI